ncbi:MAG: sialidase family protein [Marinoscillum sp.]
MKELAKNKLLLIGLLIALLIACSGSDDPSPKDPEVEEPEDTTNWVIDRAIDGKPISHIEWGEAIKVSHEVYSAAYPRMLQLGNSDTLLLGYHGGDPSNDWDNIYLRKSFDRGLTWSETSVLMTDNDPDYWGFANPEFVELRSGRILMAFTGRGRPDDNQHDNIQVMHSDDRGDTWSNPRIVAYGRSWEPAMVEHPSGEVMMFYSSEARWWQVSDYVEQEILMVISANIGMSWSNSKSVAYSSGHRDGMPVPVVLKDRKGLAFVIESVGNADGPWVLHSDLMNRFKEESEITRRLAAPKSLVGFGGGPYLAQLPTGETILSLHDTGGRSIGSNWMKNTMYVLIGNEQAKNFEKVSYPFPDLPSEEGAFFNSVCVLDENTVIALASRNFEDGHNEVHWATGTVIREE